MSDTRTTAEEVAAAWWASLDANVVRLELIGNMSPIEVRMLGRWTP